MVNRQKYDRHSFWGVVLEIFGSFLRDVSRLLLVVLLFVAIAIVSLALYLQIPLLLAAIVVALAVLAFFVIGLFSQ